MAPHGKLAAMKGLVALIAAIPLCAQTQPAAVCGQCHAAEHAEWSAARHAKMLQPATPNAVKGDFGRHDVTLRNLPFALRVAGGQYFITESFLTGSPTEHRVDYTLGSRRIQHYITRLPDGRMLVLPPTWDVQRRQWFHNLDIVNPEESDPGVVQIWNRNCYSCHVSQQTRSFSPTSLTYATEWTDYGTNCIRCHGPSNRHAARAKPDDVVLQTRLDPVRSTMICAQCHSLREISAEGYTAGADYNDFYLSILEYNEKATLADPSFWLDGRPRRFSDDAIGFWQSQCFLKGKATCLNCHSNVHDPEIEKAPQLKPGANAICTSCHMAIASDISAHTHHSAQSAGSACVECHMPRSVFSIKAAIRDHSISLPAPENTLAHNIPNACNETCHRDRGAAWSRDELQKWFGAGKRQKFVDRADAFAAARRNDVTAIPNLIAILSEPAEGFLIRANAAGHLGRFSADPRTTPALLRALTDPEPRVRAAAALGLRTPEAAPALRRAIEDPLRSVRISAARSLVALGPRFVPRNDPAFTKAAAEVRQHFEISPDDAAEQFIAGQFYLFSGQPQLALDAFRLAVRLDPTTPAAYFAAAATAAAGRIGEARVMLQRIPAKDPHYSEARQLLISLSKQ
jgi:tetratricopeptide (TPR) repeat protein